MRSTATQEDGDEAAQNYLALIGVGVFTHDALVVSDVLEGLAGETPLAAVIVEVLGTVHQLLFCQREQLPTCDGDRRLQGPCGGEGPATATATLIFHW